MDVDRALKFFQGSHATWVDLGGKYLALLEKDVEDLRQTVSGPQVRVQDMTLTREQARAILGHFS